uniref:Amino acid permease 6-like n=1 Tax=Tanacetum cinerariifolium TaxID=118510 RepID=A0A6L2L1F9_TANCI|nr:amino acid permease 6-like [Tanacetum cinerariifolium]
MYEHVGPKVTSSQDDKKRLCLVDDLKGLKITYSHTSQDKGTSSSLKSMITTQRCKTKDQLLYNKDSRSSQEDSKINDQGTLMTASAHIITAVIGSGVLSLAWAIAQLGWVAGPAVLMAFSFITYFTSTLLADSYRTPDPVSGKRNYTYMDVVQANLGGIKVQLCGIAQYVNLVGVTIGYTITASISMV